MATLYWRDAPHRSDYQLVQGDSIPERWSVQVDAVAKTLNAVGASVKLTVWDENGTAKITARSLTISGANNSVFAMGITAADTAAWDGTYIYKVVLVLPSGDGTYSEGSTKTLLEGAITVRTIPS